MTERVKNVSFIKVYTPINLSLLFEPLIDINKRHKEIKIPISLTRAPSIERNVTMGYQYQADRGIRLHQYITTYRYQTVYLATRRINYALRTNLFVIPCTLFTKAYHIIKLFNSAFFVLLLTYKQHVFFISTTIYETLVYDI